jgi:hypothetical protein
MAVTAALFPRSFPQPQTLLDRGHKTRDQLACHEALHQTFGVGEILLMPLRPAVRRRLRQMQFPDIRPAPSQF